MQVQIEQSETRNSAFSHNSYGKVINGSNLREETCIFIHGSRDCNPSLEGSHDGWTPPTVAGPCHRSGIRKQRVSRESRTTYNFPGCFSSVQRPPYRFQFLKILQSAETVPPAVDQVSKQRSPWGTFYIQIQANAIRNKRYSPTDFWSHNSRQLISGLKNRGPNPF